MAARVSIVIVTYRRPDSVRECLRCLSMQSEAADQLIVVDASEDSSTEDTVASFDGVVYLRNPAGAGNISSSRNVGLRVADGDILAFLDDDAFPEPGYVQNLRRAYADPTVALACSRTLNGLPNEAFGVAGGVGRLLDDGRLIGNFAFDAGAGKVVDIDHGIGATMSFRRSTLRAMGGFREAYSGISGVREDADAFLRARRLGLRAVFINDAVARHMAAPQAKGQRFDLRYEYWTARNHALLLINNFGLSNPLLLRSVAGHFAATLADRNRSSLRRYARALVGVSGFLRGVGITLYRQQGRSLPARRDGLAAEDLRDRLGQAGV
jgi:GT2 family glycosyltransferase